MHPQHTLPVVPHFLKIMLAHSGTVFRILSNHMCMWLFFYLYSHQTTVSMLAHTVPVCSLLCMYCMSWICTILRSEKEMTISRWTVPDWKSACASIFKFIKHLLFYKLTKRLLNAFYVLNTKLSIIGEQEIIPSLTLLPKILHWYHLDQVKMYHTTLLTTPLKICYFSWILCLWT